MRSLMCLVCIILMGYFTCCSVENSDTTFPCTLTTGLVQYLQVGEKHIQIVYYGAASGKINLTTYIIKYTPGRRYTREAKDFQIDVQRQPFYVNISHDYKTLKFTVTNVEERKLTIDKFSIE